MPSIIIATAKSATANSYVTLAEADAYFGDRLHKSNWLNADLNARMESLLWATKILDTRIVWSGNKTTTTQALDWPRKNVEDPEQPADQWGSIAYLNEDTVPQNIKDAQCEMALALIGSDTTLDADSTGINSFSAGSLSVDFNVNLKSYVLPRPVRDLVMQYGSSYSGSGMVSLIRA